VKPFFGKDIDVPTAFKKIGGEINGVSAERFVKPVKPDSSLSVAT
jgi:hypothetical protein